MSHDLEWTEGNESDPGVTLLELVAFLACGYLFMTSMDRILERLGLIYRLDPADGSVEFGDGARGAIPPGLGQVGSRYRYGGGAAALVGTVAIGCALWATSIWKRWPRARRSGVVPSREAVVTSGCGSSVRRCRLPRPR